MTKYGLLLLIISFASFSQESEQAIYSPTRDYTQQQVDTLIVQFQQRVLPVTKIEELNNIFKSNKNLLGKIFYYRVVMDLAFNENDFENNDQRAIRFGDSAIQLYENTRLKRDFEEKHLLNVYYLRAKAKYNLGMYADAIEDCQKALEYHKKYPWQYIAFLKAEIARNHLSMGNNEVALKYYLENANDSLHMSLARPAVSTYTRIGVIYSYYEQWDKAKDFLSKALSTSQQKGYLNNLNTIYGNLGMIDEIHNNEQGAIENYKNSIDAYKEQSSDNKMNRLLNNYHESYLSYHKGEMESTIIKLKDIIGSYDTIEKINKGDKDMLLSAYTLLAKAFGKTGNTEQLQFVIKESNEMLEAYYNGQLKENLSELEIDYQTKQKDASIVQLEKTSKAQQTIIKQRNTINWVLGGLLLSFVGLGYLFYRQRRLQNHYKTSNLEQRLLRSQLNPHFLFNALNSVSGLVQKKSDQTIPYISKLGNLLRSILENSREEFISLEEELDTISTYLELQSDFSKKFTFDIEIVGGLNKEELLIPPMFLQPFIENAIDHGFQGKDDEKITITVDQKLKDKVLYFSIKDNGVGCSETLNNREKKNKHQSLSGTILKERLELYAKMYKSKAFYSIEDLEIGTKVHLHLPYQLDV